MALRVDQLEGDTSWSSGPRASASGATHSSRCACPKLYNLRSDPFERGDVTRACSTTSGWSIGCSCSFRRRQIVGEFLKTFEEFPPRQKPASFSIDEALDKVRETEKQLETANGGSVK